VGVHIKNDTTSFCCGLKCRTSHRSTAFVAYQINQLFPELQRGEEGSLRWSPDDMSTQSQAHQVFTRICFLLWMNDSIGVGGVSQTFVVVVLLINHRRAADLVSGHRFHIARTYHPYRIKRR
jgi:hypothetical protein